MFWTWTSIQLKLAVTCMILHSMRQILSRDHGQPGLSPLLPTVSSMMKHCALKITQQSGSSGVWSSCPLSKPRYLYADWTWSAGNAIKLYTEVQMMKTDFRFKLYLRYFTFFFFLNIQLAPMVASAIFCQSQHKMWWWQLLCISIVHGSHHSSCALVGEFKSRLHRKIN